MKTKENLTETVKLRISHPAHESLVETARQNNITVSELIRSMISDPLHFGNVTPSIAVQVQCNMVRYRYRNAILAMGLSEKITKSIIKELENLDS